MRERGRTRTRRKSGARERTLFFVYIDEFGFPEKGNNKENDFTNFPFSFFFCRLEAKPKRTHGFVKLTVKKIRF